MIFHGEKKISKVFHGDREISRVYRGDKLVLQKKTPRYEIYKWLLFRGMKTVSTNLYGVSMTLTTATSGPCNFVFKTDDTYEKIAQFPLVFNLFPKNELRINKNIRLNKGYIVYQNGGNNIDVLFSFGKIAARQENKIEINFPNIKVNGVSYTNMEGEIYNIVLSSATRSFDGAFSKIETNENIFYPCKLLDDFGRNLTADKKTHYAGECGFIDNKNIFYANTSQYGFIDVTND